jgi:hypothetical protein
MKNPKTTYCGIGLAVCQAIAFVPYIAPYGWVFQCLGAVLGALMGYFAADATKGV